MQIKKSVFTKNSQKYKIYTLMFFVNTTQNLSQKNNTVDNLITEKWSQTEKSTKEKKECKLIKLNCSTHYQGFSN